MKGTIGFKELFIQNLTKLKIANFRKKNLKNTMQESFTKRYNFAPDAANPTFFDSPYIKTSKKAIID